MNSNKEDILGRRVPRRIVDWQNHFELSHHNPRSKKAKSRQTDLIIPDNLRPANSISVLIGPDKKIFELYFFPKNTSFEGIFNDNLRWLIFICVMVLSISVSYLLSRAITNPIRRFKHATRSIADGNFLTKVSDSVSQRKDEIGSLARDINRMSEKLYQYEEQAEELLQEVLLEAENNFVKKLIT